MTSSVPRDYSLIAPLYDQIFNGFLEEGHKKIGHLIKRKQQEEDFRVLEVGVGSGLTLDYLPTSVNYTGIDINSRMLELAKAKARLIRRRKIHLSLMDAQKLSFKNGAFDLVAGASVITAVEYPSLAMREMIRVTKKGGHIALIANVRSRSRGSQVIKRFDPFTKRFLGFRTDLDAEYFHKFDDIRLIEEEKINYFLGFSLSTFLLFEKI